MDLTSFQLYPHLLLASAQLTLPGTAAYLLARRLDDGSEVPGIARSLVVGSGLSVALWPLLLFFVSLAGLAFSSLLVWAVLLLSLLVVLFSALARRPERTTAKPEHRERLLTGLALGGMTALALAFRLGDAQGLTVPMFGDSLHHTMITDIILSTGRVPSGYLPYVPVETFTYHFGFHALAAVFGQLSGAGSPYAVLLVGQVLNALSLPMAYLLSRELFGSRLAGLGAAFVTGFVSIMPAYYVNWGRYTQLAGQVLLVVAVVFTTRLMSRHARRSDLLLAALCVAGLIVVHYRILIFFGLFALALGAWQLATCWRDRRALLAGYARGLLAVVVSLLVTLPWLINLLVNYVPGLAARLGSVTAEYLAEYNDPGTIFFYVGRFLPVLALVGLLLALTTTTLAQRLALPATRSALPTIQPYSAALVLTLWMVLIIGSLWIRPGAIGGYAVAIVLYIPLAALGGYAIGWALEWLGALSKKSASVLALSLLPAAPLAAFAFNTWHVIDTRLWLYVHPPDLQAFDWIKRNLPQDARFLISSEFTYQGRGVTASDAGMWLPLLTGRTVSVPALSTWIERPTEPDFFTDTRHLAAFTQPLDAPPLTNRSTQAILVASAVITQARSLADPVTLELMRKLRVTHVYSGAPGGASRPRLDIETMRRDTRHYRLIYSEGGVFVFEVIY